MKFGTFYLLPQEPQKKHNTFNYVENLIFNITIKKWRSGKTILITCDDKYQAKKIDELLWTFDKNTFLPHNLFTNNIRHTPVIIYWPEFYSKNITKDILINLMKKNMDFFFNFNEIIDFVPFSENLKKLARNRYLSYKRIGFQLRIITYSSIL